MRVAIYCYPSADPWSPRNMESGIGGSEEAVIHIASALAARGHEVTVINARSGPSERIGGVTWSSYETKNGADVGVIWRRAEIIERVGLSAARRFYLWLHDMVPEVKVLPWLGAFSKVMVLSRFHRNHYPAIPAGKLFMTTNGVDSAQFVPTAERDPKMMVYGSCYTRGLRTLLANWTQIRQAVPNARINVFYGWQTIQRNNPVHYDRLRSVIEPLFSQEGVTHLGRIGHAEVARQYSTAGLWAYPCLFPETSCISGMKAQCGGAVPVVIPSGALAETVRFGFKTMRGYTDFSGLPFPRCIIDEWLNGLIGLLRSPDRQASIRAEMIPNSRRRFAWSSVAEAWEREFACA